MSLVCCSRRPANHPKHIWGLTLRNPHKQAVYSATTFSVLVIRNQKCRADLGFLSKSIHGNGQRRQQIQNLNELTGISIPVILDLLPA